MKKFITIALAVAVLFSFAACQPTYKHVIAVTATTDKTEYLVGDEIDLSSIAVTVKYSDGSSEDLTGNDVTVAVTTSGADGLTVKQGLNTVQLSYGSVVAGSGYGSSATVEIMGRTAKSAVLSNLPTEGVVNKTALTGVTAVVTDEAGNEYELAYPELKVNLGTTIASTAGKKTLGKDNVSVYAFATSVEKSWEGTWTITLATEAGDPEPADVVSIQSVSLRDGIDAVYYGGLAYEDNEIGTQAITAADFVAVGLTKDGKAVDLVGGTHFSVTFSKPIATTLGSMDVEVKPVDSVTTFATSVKSNVFTIVDGLGTPVATIGENNTISLADGATKVLSASDVKITAKLASDSNKDAAGTFKVTNISDMLIDSEATSLTDVVITFTWSGDNYAREYSATVASVTVTRT